MIEAFFGFELGMGWYFGIAPLLTMVVLIGIAEMLGIGEPLVLLFCIITTILTFYVNVVSPEVHSWAWCWSAIHAVVTILYFSWLGSENR